MGFQVGSSGGSAAAPRGEARPHRHAILNSKSVEAEPRRKKSSWALSVSRRLTVPYCGGAVHRALLTLLLLTACCLLPSEIAPSLTAGLLPLTFSQNQPQPTPTPTPLPAPSPSPSPTPPPNLHQWGAVTSFH